MRISQFAPENSWSLFHMFPSRYQRSVQRHAFSLLEIVVAIVALLILVTLLVPIYHRIVFAAHNSICQVNLRSIGRGMDLYSYDHDHWMPPHLETFIYPDGGRVYPMWYFWVSPYITGTIVTDPERTPMDKVFHCPANPKPYDSAVTYYARDLGKGDYSYGYLYRFLTSKKGTSYVNMLPMRRTLVPDPASLILIADIPNRVDGLRTYEAEGARKLNAGWMHPSVERIGGTHNGAANILYLDGRVEQRKVADIMGENYHAGNWCPYYQ